MSLLADTHTLIWWLSDSARLSRVARAVLADPARQVYVSAASAWEITTKHRLGKIAEAEALAADVEGEIRRQGFLPLSVTMVQAELAGRLRNEHRDPFDRMLVAQALLENLTLVSNDAALDRFGVTRLW